MDIDIHFTDQFIASLALSYRALDYQLTSDEYDRALFREKTPLNNSYHIVSLVRSFTKNGVFTTYCIKAKVSQRVV